MIPTVVCVYFDGTDTLPSYSGGVYDWNWVEKLYKGVKRHCSTPFRFLCLTDLPPDDPSPDIEIAPLFDSSEGWLCINEIFRPNLGIDHGIFMGLDTVIVSDVTDILNWRGGLGMVKSPYGDGAICNPILSFSRTWGNWLWRMWDTKRNYWRRASAIRLGPTLEDCPSELVFLRLNRHEEWVDLGSLWPNQIVSWKMDEITDEARIIYFHGDPKPNQIDDPIVNENWV